MGIFGAVVFGHMSTSQDKAATADHAHPVIHPLTPTVFMSYKV